MIIDIIPPKAFEARNAFQEALDSVNQIEDQEEEEEGSEPGEHKQFEIKFPKLDDRGRVLAHTDQEQEGNDSPKRKLGGKFNINQFRYYEMVRLQISAFFFKG